MDIGCFVSSFVIFPLGFHSSPVLRFRDYNQKGWPFLQPKSSCSLGLTSAASAATRNNSTERETTTTTPVIRKQDDGRSDEIIQTIANYYSNNAQPEKQSDETRLRGNIQLVAGSGKTYVAWRVMERLLLLDPEWKQQQQKTTKQSTKQSTTTKQHSPPPKIGLFVTPFLNLIDQALTNKEEHGIMEGFDTETLIVASRTSRSETSTTKATDIYNFLSKPSKNADAKILVCTYNSLPRVGTALRMWQEEDIDEVSTKRRSIDFAVFDEAHKMEGWNRPRGKDDSAGGFVYGLYDSNLDIQHRLFMSGTPHNYTQDAKVIECLPNRPRTDGARKYTPLQNSTTESDENSNDDSEVTAPRIRSFADENLFGPCLARKTHQESVEENITLPISLYGVETSVLEDYSSQQLPSDGYRKDYFLPVAIRSAFQSLPIRHAVSFHSTNQRARDFLDLAQDLESSNEHNSTSSTPISLFHMNGHMPPAQRNQILEMAREAPRSLITNCRVLATGVDEASLDMVVIADPVQSSTDGRQMIGRVGRKAPGKDRGYVLIPLPVDTDLDTDDDNHPYRLFVSIFQNMVALDPELKQDVLLVISKSKELNRTLVQSEYPKRLQEAFLFDSRISIELQYQLMDRAIVEYAGSRRKEDNWDGMISLLAKYKEREGDCNVPAIHQEDGENLGEWLSRQRKYKKKGTLDGDFESTLTSLGVVWDVLAQQWEDKFLLLEKYKDREGDCNAPQEYKEDGENLGEWLNRQRQNKKKGVLDSDLEARLTSLGVVWDVLAQQWEDMFALLAKYKEREGDCNVPANHQEDGENLGLWLSRQRAYKKKGTLGSDLEERLTSRGVVWDMLAQQWEDMFALLVQYKEREGDCNVPQAHKEDGIKLGSWLSRQRNDKKSGVLDSDLEERLTSLGVVWDVLAQQWEDMFSLLVQYKDREGDCNVPQGHKEDGIKLGSWLRNQRNTKKSGVLDSDLEERLTSLGVVWDVLAQQWEDMFSLLVQYKEREGDCNVPAKHNLGQGDLGQWLSRQKHLKKEGLLSVEREEKLATLGVAFEI